MKEDSLLNSFLNANKKTSPSKQAESLFCIHSSARSHRGLVRLNNEDNLYFKGIIMPLENMNDGCTLASVSDMPWQVYAVLDGMGGEQSGEWASFTAAQVLCEKMHDMPSDGRAALRNAVRLANSRVLDVGRARLIRRIGSTLTIICFLDGKALVANIGDSRVYLMRQGKLVQLTEDQTDASRRLRMGLITPEQAVYDKGRHVLTQHIGIEPEELELEPAFSDDIALQNGDTFLLCSDGLYDMVDDASIMDILKQDGDVGAIARALVEKALAQQGKDNVTVIVLKIIIKTETKNRI